MLTEPDLGYEYSDIYSHMMIFSTSKDPKKVFDKFKQEVNRMAKEGIDEKTFNRTRNKIYGRIVTSYNSASQIARFFMRDYLNNIVSFDDIEKWKEININDANEM